LLVTKDTNQASAFLGHPLLDVTVLAFFLHFVWEFWQVPWYAEMSAMPHLDGILVCSRATLGDVFITLFGYALISLAARDWFWIRNATLRRVTVYVFIGLMVTVVLEFLATDVLDRWQYAADMWVVPLVGTGMAPILQWIVIPLLSVFALRRLWSGRREPSAATDPR
jgi:hypothetical protein